jgi:signal peptidase I
MSKWIAVAFVCCVLALAVPPVGVVAIVVGIVALLRGRIRVGVVLVVLGVLVPIAGSFIVQSFFVKPYRIPSEAMVPTLQVGDRLVVWRASTEPHRGDIVVFHPPASAEESGACGVRQLAGEACARSTPDRADVSFIKRVVAGPGDRLAIVDGHVVLNGKRQSEPFIADTCGAAEFCQFPRTITIPPDHWFMMGDNRGSSDDSRFWGPVPRDWITGRAFFRYWPVDRAGGL